MIAPPPEELMAPAPSEWRQGSARGQGRRRAKAKGKGQSRRAFADSGNLERNRAVGRNLAEADTILPEALHPTRTGAKRKFSAHATRGSSSSLVQAQFVGSRSLAPDGTNWRRTARPSTRGMLFGKHRNEKPSPYAHVGLPTACVGGAVAISVQTAYHISRSIPAVVLAAEDQAIETAQTTGE